MHTITHTKFLFSTPIAGFAAILLTGCTWVEPTEEGYAVGLIKATAAQNCRSLGTATVEVADKVGPFARSDKKVQNELITMAKNEAANMGGDTIVEVAPESDGRQQFKVYQCD